MTDYTITDSKTHVKVTIREEGAMTRKGFEDRKGTVHIDVEHPAGWSLSWKGAISIDENGYVECPLVDHLDPKPELYMGKKAPHPICGDVEDALTDYGSQYDEVSDPEGEYKDEG